VTEQHRIWHDNAVNESLHHISGPASWIFEIKFSTAVHFRYTFCIILPTFVNIGDAVAKISQHLSETRFSEKQIALNMA